MRTQIEIYENQSQLLDRLRWYQIIGEKVDSVRQTVQSQKVFIQLIHHNETRRTLLRLRGFKANHIRLIGDFDSEVIDEAIRRCYGISEAEVTLNGEVIYKAPNMDK